MDGVDLHWLPLGAGGWFVKRNGRLYEALAAWRGRRARCDLYHAGLEVRLAGVRWVIEMTPVPDARGADRGVVAGGPVGFRPAGRFRLFRYEVRCWPGGTIPDIAYAVGGPVRLSTDPAVAGRLLGLVPEVPPLVWGRDEIGAGEMWNSNSIVAWLLAGAGIDAAAVSPPPGGRAPGWRAGLVAHAKR